MNSCLYLRFSFTGQPRLIWSCPKQIRTYSLARGNTLLLGAEGTASCRDGVWGEALLWGMKYKLEPEGLIISAPPSYQPWMTSRGAGVCKQLFTLTWPRLEAGHTLWRSQNIGQGCVGSLQVAILRLRSYSDRDHHCSNTTLALMKLGMYNTRAFVWG